MQKKLSPQTWYSILQGQKPPPTLNIPEISMLIRESEERRILLKNRLYIIHGFGGIRKSAATLGVSYSYLRAILAGHRYSEPILGRLAEYLDAEEGRRDNSRHNVSAAPHARGPQ